MIWNEKVLKKALIKYPGLEVTPDLIIRGSLEIMADVNFDIEVTRPKSSWLFPSVKEVGEKIPRVPDRHVNSDGTLCLAVPPVEFSICKAGISLNEFIDKVLIPHLAREFVREETKTYPQGEYSHGADGIWEYFQEFFELTDKDKLLKLIELAINDSGIDKYGECLCGSRKKFKFCHFPKCQELREIGKDNLKRLMNQLKP